MPRPSDSDEAGPVVTLPVLDSGVLAMDFAHEAEAISRWLLATVATTLRRRGAVVALSGGVDSAVCAALAVRALGAERVFGLLLPEQESSPDSLERGRLVATHLAIAHQIHDVTPALASLGCYEHRNQAMQRIFPEYSDGWKSKIVIAGGTERGINFFKLVAQSPAGDNRVARLPAREYLDIVAATNFKQRVRKTMEYFHADRLQYAVVGTPNRLEHDQGFFVKNGDGAADIKPIAHLYKTQVFGLARWFGLPDEICEAVPTTGTYTLAQGQDEFYFALPYQQMDLALWAFEQGRSAGELADALGIDEARAARVYRDIEAKRRAASYLHAAAARFAPSRESGP